MGTAWKTAVVFLLAGLFISPLPLNAVENNIKVGMGEGKAEITLLRGQAFQMWGKEKRHPLAVGDFLQQGDRVQTAKNARIEIKLPDNSFVRFDELTQFELNALDVGKKEKKRNINIRMILGKTWAKVAKFFAERSRFAISTRTAVAGVRGTVYRMNVNEDNSAEVKVYWGEVVVRSREKAANDAAAFQNLSAPKPVSGPHPIPGPTPVSMKEWTHILKSMQQIIIHPDGTATKPFRFSITADENEWVRWNRERDEKNKDSDNSATE